MKFFSFFGCKSNNRFLYLYFVTYGFGDCGSKLSHALRSPPPCSSRVDEVSSKQFQPKFLMSRLTAQNLLRNSLQSVQQTV